MTKGASDFVFTQSKNTSQHFPTRLRFLSYRMVWIFHSELREMLRYLQETPETWCIRNRKSFPVFHSYPAVWAQYYFPRSLNLGPPVISTRMTYRCTAYEFERAMTVKKILGRNSKSGLFRPPGVMFHLETRKVDVPH